MSIPKLAASLLVCRPSNNTFQVLMVKRHAKARFMPNYHVFPGGIGMYKHALSDQSVEMSDSSPAWDGAEERTLKIAALRELYEEANLLVSNPHIPADQLRDAHRKDLNENANMFLSICQHYSCYPDISRVHNFERWITPKQEKFRYDTYFYCIVLDEELTVNGAEITALDWLSPTEALRSYQQEKIILAPPTFLILAHLSKFKDTQELLDECKSGRNMEPQEPVITVEDNTMVIALVGDKLNGGDETARKRVWAKRTETGWGRWKSQGLGLEFDEDYKAEQAKL